MKWINPHPETPIGAKGWGRTGVQGGTACGGDTPERAHDRGPSAVRRIRTFNLSRVGTARPIELSLLDGPPHHPGTNHRWMCGPRLLLYHIGANRAIPLVQLARLLCAGIGGQLDQVDGPERVLVRPGDVAVPGGCLVVAVRGLSCVALIAHSIPFGTGLLVVVVLVKYRIIMCICQ